MNANLSMKPNWVKFWAFNSWLLVFIVCSSTNAATFYVDVNSSNPTLPYADLSTAAVSIQDAVDAATNGDLILVNDGVYQDGFRTSQEVVVLGPRSLSHL